MTIAIGEDAGEGIGQADHQCLNRQCQTEHLPAHIQIQADRAQEQPQALTDTGTQGHQHRSAKDEQPDATFHEILSVSPCS